MPQKPWEKYQTSEGPWTKYQQQSLVQRAEPKVGMPAPNPIANHQQNIMDFVAGGAGVVNGALANAGKTPPGMVNYKGGVGASPHETLVQRLKAIGHGTTAVVPDMIQAARTGDRALAGQATAEGLMYTLPAMAAAGEVGRTAINDPAIRQPLASGVQGVSNLAKRYSTLKMEKALGARGASSRAVAQDIAPDLSQEGGNWATTGNRFDRPFIDRAVAATESNPDQMAEQVRGIANARTDAEANMNPLERSARMAWRLRGMAAPIVGAVAGGPVGGAVGAGYAMYKMLPERGIASIKSALGNRVSNYTAGLAEQLRGIPTEGPEHIPTQGPTPTGFQRVPQQQQPTEQATVNARIITPNPRMLPPGQETVVATPTEGTDFNGPLTGQRQIGAPATRMGPEAGKAPYNAPYSRNPRPIPDTSGPIPGGSVPDTGQLPSDFTGGRYTKGAPYFKGTSYTQQLIEALKRARKTQ